MKTMMPPVPVPVSGQTGPAALDAADAAMLFLGLARAACGRCGARMYVFEGLIGPFRCSRPGCCAH